MLGAVGLLTGSDSLVGGTFDSAALGVRCDIECSRIIDDDMSV